jgi:hypothetical protein
MTKCEKECEVFSRVVGYYRPVQFWNDGKRAEFFDRKTFCEKKSMESAKKFKNNKLMEFVKEE